MKLTSAIEAPTQVDQRFDAEQSYAIAMRFLRETEHLGLEGQARVLRAVLAAWASKKKREAAHAYPPIEPERIDANGGPPPPGVISTYTPPTPYNVGSDDQ